MKQKGVQITSGHGPGQLTLSVPGGAGVLDQVTSECPWWSRGVRPGDLRMSLPITNMLLYCDPVYHNNQHYLDA